MCCGLDAFSFHLKRLFLINPVTLPMKGLGLVYCRGNGSGLDGSEHQYTQNFFQFLFLTESIFATLVYQIQVMRSSFCVFSFMKNERVSGFLLAVTVVRALRPNQ